MQQLCPELAISNVIDHCIEATLYNKAHHLPPPTVGEVRQYFTQPGAQEQEKICQHLFAHYKPEDWFIIDKGGYLAVRNTLTFARLVCLYSPH